MSTKSPEDIRAWDRWFAVECNNQAWDLVEQASRTAEDAEKMLQAAHAAAHHWSRVGTELNFARADLLLGQVHALLGNGALALRYAQRSYDFFAARPDTPDWEIAFAHAVLAHAAHAAGHAELHALRHASASDLGARVTDATEREIFLRTWRQVPAPAPERTGDL